MCDVGVRPAKCRPSTMPLGAITFQRPIAGLRTEWPTRLACNGGGLTCWLDETALLH